MDRALAPEKAQPFRPSEADWPGSDSWHGRLAKTCQHAHLVRELAGSVLDFCKVRMRADERLPDRIVECVHVAWCRAFLGFPDEGVRSYVSVASQIILIEHDRPSDSCFQTRKVTDEFLRDWIHRSLGKIHMMHFIDRMAEELRTQAAKLLG